MLITQPPAQVRILLATREEPALGLHRLRLAGELTELRGPDLRFSLDETRALFRAGGITLSDQAVASLHERTEGWAAGLRLAAISLAAHPDPERFVSEFSGSERTVAGYLLAEVLERQAPEVRDLLLRTSVLERVSGRWPTCSPVARGPRRSSSGSKTRTPSSPHWTPPYLVPLPPPVRRSLAPRIAARRAGDDPLAEQRRPPGTNRRATSSKPSATIKRPVTGHRLDACSWTTTSR